MLDTPALDGSKRVRTSAAPHNFDSSLIPEVLSGIAAETMHRTKNAKRLYLRRETLLSLTELRHVVGASIPTQPRQSCIELCAPVTTVTIGNTVVITCTSGMLTCNSGGTVFC